jgi:hypothetical protein
MEARTRLPNMATTHRLPQAERMGPTPLHNLTPVGSATCQSRQAPSYPSADTVGYESVQAPAKHGNHVPLATRQSGWDLFHCTISHT